MTRYRRLIERHEGGAKFLQCLAHVGRVRVRGAVAVPREEAHAVAREHRGDDPRAGWDPRAGTEALFIARRPVRCFPRDP